MNHLILLGLFMVGTYTATCTAASPTNRLATLPAGSALYQIPDGQLHVRTLQPKNLQAQARTPLAIVLLAGPNENYHADTGWFALLQPLLAKQHRTFAIDRQSSGFSSDTTHPSYRRFAADLLHLLPQLPADRFLLVSFASGSISARLLADNPTLTDRLAGLVLIDPDVPTPDALALYNGPPTDWYRANLAQLLPKLAEGIWQQRTDDKLARELSHIQQLIPPALQADMDWDYLNRLSNSRRSIARQQARAIEITEYQADLASYSQTPWLQSAVPVSIIDGSFELAGTQSLPAAEQQILTNWQQQGSSWSLQLSQNSGGRYLSLADTEHLLMFSSAQALQHFIHQLMTALTTQPKVNHHPSQTVN